MYRNRYIRHMYFISRGTIAIPLIFKTAIVGRLDIVRYTSISFHSFSACIYNEIWSDVTERIIVAVST